MYPRILALGLAVLCISARAGDLIPIEDFAKAPTYSDLKMSPDGEYIGFIREQDGVGAICFASIATMKIEVLGLSHHLPKSYRAPGFLGFDIWNFDWIGSRRVMLRTELGWAAVNTDNEQFKYFSWDEGSEVENLEVADHLYGSVIHTPNDDRVVLATVMNHSTTKTFTKYPQVTKLDTLSGRRTTVLKNPGKVTRWIADVKGVVRCAVSMDENEEAVLYRASEKDDWVKIAKSSKLEMDPMGFSEDGTSLYVFIRPETGVGGLYQFDLGPKVLGAVIWKNPVYEPTDLVRDPTTQKLVGLRYEAEYSKTQWFDDRFSAFQIAVDKALPGKVNRLEGFNRDLSRVLVNSYSDRAPAIAYIFNPSTGELREMGKSRAWIKPEQMASTKPVSYVSRDGVRIYSYLTVPAGSKPENLPLVVLLRKELSGRETWGFNPFVQLLASRGYAVLQVNYRGSSGYGLPFKRMGDGETGGRIQADIEDAVRWMISKKIVDPGRIALVGNKYGGYSALYALAKSPDLYCCAVASSPVTNWPVLINEVGQNTRIQPLIDLETLTAIENESEKLQAISPVNFASQIKAPVLFIKRELSITWAEQVRQMMNSLGKSQCPHELFIVPYSKGYKERLAEYRAVEAFLAKHLGPGATASAPVAPATGAAKTN